MDIEILMKRMGESGVTVLLKMDAERLAEAQEAWTFVATGAPLGPEGSVRVDAWSMAECVNAGLGKLREQGHNWDWLDGI